MLQDFAVKFVEDLNEKYRRHFEVHRTEHTNNVVKIGVVERQPGDAYTSPVIYLQDFYQEAESGEDYSKLLEDFKEMFDQALTQSKTMLGVTELNSEAYILSNVFLSVISYDMNTEILQGVPHRQWLDLAIVCRVLVGGIGVDATALINNSVFENLSTSEEELFAVAAKNTFTHPELCTKTRSMQSILSLFQPNLIEDTEQLTGPQMFVLCTNTGRYGSAAIGDTKALTALSDQLNSDLYILPSSVHELIALPKSEVAADVSVLREMVQSVNDTVLNTEEILSYNVYLFDRETKEVRIA